MMPLIATAWVALASAAISPGPNMVAVASRGLGSGRLPALTVAAGLACGAFAWAILTAVGLGQIFALYPGLLRLLGAIGGAYLVWLGIKGWRSALTGSGGQIAPVAGAGLRHDFLHGLAVTATNPKVALLWATLSTFVGPAIQSWGGLLVFTTGSALIIFAIYGSYGLLFSTGRARGLYTRFQQMSEAVFGTLFGALGMLMINRSL
ncbi:LysE family translocator [Salipiger abyssi]|uniref:LysE family translocator n=1 Tax=Salipiger abyssi TaxID=1250539 RepID=UPI001A8F925F|nr:LysE family translocator [Salipiger abyssi]MBN9886233.1 LysE family translocator [Salipiger abyssi]